MIAGWDRVFVRVLCTSGVAGWALLKCLWQEHLYRLLLGLVIGSWAREDMKGVPHGSIGYGGPSPNWEEGRGLRGA